MASYIDPSFRESLLKPAHNRTAQVRFFKLPFEVVHHALRIGLVVYCQN